MAPPSPPPSSGETTCKFGQCFCQWRAFCSPRIPSVAPGRDYENMPAGGGADDDERAAARSVLVGYLSCISGREGETLLRLHRLRVARSGRVLGRSGDAFEILDADVEFDYEGKDASSRLFDVSATPGPDADGGRSLFVFCREIDDLHHIGPPRPFKLDLNLAAAAAAADGDRGVTVSPLPGLPPPELKPGMRRPVRPISAAGHLWAPYITFAEYYNPSGLGMLRLDKDAGLWVEVASIALPQEARRPEGGYRVLEGYAVVGSTMLLSVVLKMQPSHLFFTFDCSTNTLAAVATTTEDRLDYFSIHERGVYVEEDDTIYFLAGSTVFAYKLCKDQDQYRMAPPTMVDSLLPFREGHGLLTHLGGRIMCAVWIGDHRSLRCSCSTLHAVITTFVVQGNNSGNNREMFVPEHVNILHSTCRQVDMSPSKPSDISELCFFQVYEEFDHASAIPSQKMLGPSMPLQGMDVETGPEVLTDTCCRKILHGWHYVVRDDSAIQINKALYIICQVPSLSTVYKITISDGRLDCQGKTLTPHCTMDTITISNDKYELMEQPLSWHFVCGRKVICAVPSEENEIYRCSLDLGTISHSPASCVLSDSISRVLNVDGRIVAMSDSLEYVYILSKPPENRWMHCSTHGSVDLKRKINLSGYVVLSEDSFIVSDANTNSCFLLDLSTYRWTAVSTSSYIFGLLSGRSLYVEGFIYTLRDGRFAAYEITEQGDSYCLSDEIDLPFSWRIYWEINKTCFDYVGKDPSSGAIMFCVVQGGSYDRRGRDEHPICITTVQVKTERTCKGNLKPSIVGHVDIGTCFVEQISNTIWTSFCFVPMEETDAASKKGTPEKENATTFHGEEGSDNHESRHGRCVQTNAPAIDGISSMHQPTFKIFCKAEEGCCLAVRDGTLVLAPADSRDEHQHWFRDTRLSIAVQDEEGNPAFSLVNKATNLAIKHSLGMNHPVRLAKFNPDNYDESLLWTESCDLGKDFGCIRMIHDISLGLDAIHASGVQMLGADSTTVVLSKRARADRDSQIWKILYWDDEANATCGGLYAMPTCRIYTKAGEGFSLAARDGAVCLVPSNPDDKCQHWIKDTRYRIKDQEGYSAFALINRFSGEAIKFADTKPIRFNALSSTDHPAVKLVPYNPNYVDTSVLWTESYDLGHGFRCIRPLDSNNLNFHAFLGDKDHGTNVALRYWTECDKSDTNQCWKIDYWCVNPEVNLRGDLNLEEITTGFPALNAENRIPLKENSEPVISQTWARVVSTGKAQNKKPLVL